MALSSPGRFERARSAARPTAGAAWRAASERASRRCRPRRRASSPRTSRVIPLRGSGGVQRFQVPDVAVPPSCDHGNVIKDDLRHAGNALESAARGFDPSACSGQEAIDLVEELGRIRRLADGLLGKAAKRVEDTAAYTYENDRNAAELCSRVTGVSAGEAKRAIEVAGKLESLPETDCRGAGRDLVGPGGGADRPDCAGRSRRGAAADRGGGEGIRAVARQVHRGAGPARRPGRTGARQHAARSFRMWPTPDGMVEGHFTVTPEVGGAIEAVIDQGTAKKFRDAAEVGRSGIAGSVRGGCVRRRDRRRSGNG